jgi:type I thyroxine 5'-deiodinase
MSQQWKDQVDFVTVYVREAHPVSEDEKATATNAKAGILITEPKSLDERRGVAAHCRAALNLQSMMVVDEIDNRVANAYAAAPDRLYVVGIDGRIAYQGGPGPFGFNPSEMEQTLLLLLTELASNTIAANPTP